MLSEEQKSLLKSRHVENAKFEINEFIFNCSHNEWTVKKLNRHVDVFSFRLMNSNEFDQTIDDIFYNTEKVMFQ